MRVNTVNVFNAWKSGRSCRKARSLWTDGGTVWSYNTVVMYRNEKGQVVLNVTKYSPTTSRHQNGLRTLLDRDGSVGQILITSVGE